ncbi:uncharacterized protein LOC123009725 isoform X1 [Tribolium madens]|uniref:uncharacterized protein LOC123009725 isoform X1 n=1 Tax=Tribolium madens TaxID=41895 RepID=UPI001CF73562|nr:uncharacterized protein LOC123009725 isoform X1 [Tribolium madens]XP_044262148.1 uncharacterized protein LOC123009725 isoform X1 [Tribolium madens]XP_044262149.1 uncharacterized protein LOC123009725 isoform X1 [Tribolium madens]XP_044262150.1 uncharacterized protein LOC123009725 isoform X1 [Tribolium madens]XP_044262151.1 uncharacterized protein LOC123009725 isoform X1 [Tribolium madens]XP_044262152.1 uncharacterized protein LOC123009725 isoform X1 [Tribolium madens]XP_044262153.1 uncharac
MQILSLVLFFYFFLKNVNCCTVDVIIPDGHGSYIRTFNFVDCNLIFETCCTEGCCPRFSHAHIWIFAGTFSFIFGICVFGCWLLCCKRREGRVRPPRRDDNGDSPMVNLVVPDNRTVGGIQNTAPVTPPPSYEEATSMR